MTEMTQRDRAKALAKELRRPRVAYTLDDAADLIEAALKEAYNDGYNEANFERDEHETYKELKK